MRRRAQEIVSSFRPFRLTGRLLDVGFGAGVFLDAGKNAGWARSGTEVSERAVEQALSRGYDVRRADLTSAGFSSDWFDVVCAGEVVEHLADPGGFLREVARILRPGGLFWATTPNGRGFSARVMKLEWSVVAPGEHRQLFSMDGLRTLLQRNGFESAQLHASALNPTEILGFVRTHVRRTRREVARPTEERSRVASGYALNERMMRSRPRMLVKQVLNSALRLSRLGDSLNVRAICR